MYFPKMVSECYYLLDNSLVEVVLVVLAHGLVKIFLGIFFFNIFFFFLALVIFEY